MKVLKVLGWVILGAVFGGILLSVIASLTMQTAVVDDIDNLGNLLITVYGFIAGGIIGAIVGLIVGMVLYNKKQKAPLLKNKAYNNSKL